MATSVQIDPATGERVQSGSAQIDPKTGERVKDAPTGELRAVRPSVRGWLSEAEDDLRHGGSATIVGRTLGRMQGRGDKGYSGLEASTSPGAADFMGSMPLGAVKTAEGAVDYWTGHPLKGAGEALSGEAQMATLPGMVMAGPEADATIQAIPSRPWAQKMFDSIAQDAGKVPVNPTRSYQQIQRFLQLTQRGGTKPKVISDLVDRMQQFGKGPLTYNEARDFYSNLTRLSSEDLSTLNPVMRRQMSAVARAFSQDVADAAAKVGRASDYWSAMKNYAKASKLREAAQMMMKKFVIPAIGGAAGWGIAKKVVQSIQTGSQPTP